ncbi:MAG: NUDIX domain-containing protein [Chloroflexi bacterium]|nr:MAG: NUDIX domain-containing protein [Chloroflexota bacterium]
MARGGRRFKRGHFRGPAPPATPEQPVAHEGPVPSAAPVSSPPPRRGQAEPSTNSARGRPALVRDVSAGGVVYRRAGDEGPIEVALVGRLRPKRWALPKGTPEVGETLEGTAVREVGEETGLLVRIERPLDRIHYWFVWGGVRHSKTVHFYLMQMVGGDTANHDGEYDVVEWFPIGEALRRLSYPNEARVVDKALELLTNGG